MSVSDNDNSICNLPLKKRLFDLVLCVVTSILWLPIFITATLLMKIVEGSPVFYVSNRRVCGRRIIRLWKFRTMVRNAAELISEQRESANSHQRFLNVSQESPYYTRLGRIFEKIQLTELPQIWHVLRGQMCIVGSRPLPEAVINTLRESYPNVDKRFLLPAGLTGPVQLIGRDFIGDAQRLRLEIFYCESCIRNYSVMLDFQILLRTMLMVLRIRNPQSLAETYEFIQKYTGKSNIVEYDEPIVTEDTIR